MARRSLAVTVRMLESKLAKKKAKKAKAAAKVALRKKAETLRNQLKG